jgi:hypothetical protein
MRIDSKRYCIYAEVEGGGTFVRFKTRNPHTGYYEWKWCKKGEAQPFGYTHSTAASYAKKFQSLLGKKLRGKTITAVGFEPLKQKAKP